MDHPLPRFLLLLLAVAACDEGSDPFPLMDASVEDTSVDLSSDALVESDSRDAGEVDSAFRVTNQVAIDCPLSEERCLSWPEGGQVIRYVSEELFEGTTLERTFYVYVPDGVSGEAPVWIELHGGYGSSFYMLTTFGGLDLPGEVSWQRNTADCQFDPYTDPLVYRDGLGDECSPASVRARVDEPMIFVFPEGLLNGRIRHWEDGRIPSPGFGTTEQNRDDVGFLDHVVATLLAERDAYRVDPERLYMNGTSNGGRMTLRIFCSMGPSYPHLAQIAALGSVVSTFAEGVADGLEGRPQCDGSQVAVPIIHVAGRGFDTPDSSIDGDGFVAWGEPGGRYSNLSPQGGIGLGVEDSLTALRERLERSTGQRLEETAQTVGFFTERREWSSAGTDVRLVHLGTEGGAHQRGGSRFDMITTLRVWDFMSAFRRTRSGVVRGASAVTGDF